MARTQQKKAETESDDEFVVEKLKAHRRTKKGVLEYKVKWKGFDKASDDTWEPAEPNLSRGCKVAIEDYWKSKDPEEQLERYKVGSKEYKKLKAKLEKDAEEEQDEVASPRQKRAQAKDKSKGKTPTPTPKKKRSSDDNEEKTKSNKRAKKEEKKQVIQEEEEEEEEEEEDQADAMEKDASDEDGFDEAARNEDLVEKIETCLEGPPAYDGRPLMLIIWKKIDEAGLPYASYTDSKICRKTCPQKVIDFYETHLKFKSSADEGEDQAATTNGGADRLPGGQKQEQKQEGEEGAEQGEKSEEGEKGEKAV
ncbi:chromo domain-containing protein [Sporobolomyces salmoneus]|uniref:chromo domain-containing protein n=1 Tax=Sporobolomyces salmoneus TaxID=183962 RepID=UPI0031748B35